ncbi:MAG: FtsW/RodA/SpoVE family cell cycle protein [Clostridia bacterium]|nr:FtsW/RodA/SpoVE family cell cycle protein [Clostridia bacterium]
MLDRKKRNMTSPDHSVSVSSVPVRRAGTGEARDLAEINTRRNAVREPERRIEGEGREILLARRGIDPVYFILVLVLLLFGGIMVFSASYADAQTRFGDSFYFAKKQFLFVGMAMVIMPVVAAFPYRYFYRFSYLTYLFTVGMLVLVLVIGFASGGAQRWFSVGPISVQPSEIAKVTLVFALARYLSDHRDRVLDRSPVERRYKHPRRAGLFPALGASLYNVFIAAPRAFVTYMWRGIGPQLCLLAVIDVLVAAEKHISGLVIITALAMLVMYYAGTRLSCLAAVAGVGVAGVALLIAKFSYATQRVNVWLHPENYKLEGGWQTIQGGFAIGSGGLFGLGLGNSRLKYSYVSMPQNDFVFTIVCEELGFIGAVAVIALFAALVARGFYIAKKAPDTFASTVAFGISVHIAIQVLLNIAVVTNTIPNTGISLPFFSYGGSSLLVLAAEMGVMLSISRYSYIRK